MRSTSTVIPKTTDPVNTNPAPVQTLWGKPEAAKFYGWSIRTLEDKMRKKAVPFIKLGGGAIRFHPDVLNAHAMQNCTVTGGRK